MKGLLRSFVFEASGPDRSSRASSARTNLQNGTVENGNATASNRAAGQSIAPLSQAKQVWLGILLGLAVGQGVFVPLVYGQAWRTRTPRDTVYVPANQKSLVSSKLKLNTNLLVDFDITGTFGIFPGQNGQGFDARYTYNVANWAAPYPLPNPPYYRGVGYQVYTSVVTAAGLAEDSLRVLETAYQADHHYHARYQSGGTYFQFRIKDRLDERPDGYYYSQATGGLNIKLAQYTAGIAVQKSALDFGSINLGSAFGLLDSIASYGIDPLNVDSVWIDGPNATDFAFASQRGDRFALPNESANSFTLNFAPTHTGDCYGYLHIHTTNTDGPNHYKTISLHGFGAQPLLAIGPKLIDFGLNRVGSTKSLPVTITNGGNADLKITQIRLVVQGPSSTFTSTTAIANVTTSSPMIVVRQGGARSLMMNFTPPARAKYRATLYFDAAGVPSDSVQLIGEGAEPKFACQDSVLDFGSVRSFDQSVRMTVVHNFGNWTANVVSVQIAGSDRSAFSIVPSDPAFLLNADSSRNYAITFQPKTRSDGPRRALLIFSFDNGAPSQSVILNGEEVKPKLVYDTNAVDFGRVKLWRRVKRAVGMKNIGNASLPYFDTIKWIDTYHTFQIERSPLMGSVEPGRDSVVLSFRPTQHGPYSNWFYSDANGQRDSIFLTGIGAAPLPKFYPDTIDFGVVPTGKPGTTSTILRDSGDFPLYVIGVRITGPDAGDFTPVYDMTRKLTDTILDNGIDRARIGVNFITNGRTGRVHHATLQVIYDDSSTSEVPILAREAAQYIQFGNSKLDFGKVRVGKQSAKDAPFTNGADIPLSIGKLWTTPDGGPYVIGLTATSVDQGSISNVPVTFAPTSRGAFTGYLHAKDGDIREDSIPLTGIGAQCVPDVSTDSIFLGTMTLKQTSPSQTLVVRNIGDWPMAANIFKGRDPYNEFTVLSESASIDPLGSDSTAEGASHTYVISFTPKTPQILHEADLLFTFDDGSQKTVKLTGLDQSNFLSVDSQAINFGKVRIGTQQARAVHLVNTSPAQLIADQVLLTPSSGPFTATNTNTPLTVQSRVPVEIVVGFNPTVVGPASAMLIGQGTSFENKIGDTVQILGVGAQPVPTLSTNLLDYGLLAPGKSQTLTATLTNTGNWPLHVTNWSLAGANAADFQTNMPLDTILPEGASLDFDVFYQALTPYQPAPRTANITFTQDDGSTFVLVLVAQDKAPLATQIGFGNYVGRPGDKIFATLRLASTIPSDAAVHHITGSVTFDSNVASLEAIEPGTLTPSPLWTVAITNRTDNSFTYDITSMNDVITEKGSLLRLTFEIKHGQKPGARSPLTSFSSYPDTKEVTAQALSGGIQVDSSCGSTHLEVNANIGTFIDQNHPNPFGGTLTETIIPFDIGEDNTIVTLRVVDPTGREVNRLIDHQAYSRGHYSVPLSSQNLGSGIYFYEFKANEQQPTIKKMVVE